METVNESMIPAAAQLLGVSASELGAALRSLGKQGVPERLLSRKQAAAYIGVTYGTIKSWADTGRLPQHKLGYKTVKYRQSDIDKLLNAAKQVGGVEQKQDAPADPPAA